ncbi:MAG: hypothetical protein ABEH43_08930 [Flavobacteriales bacterium]
MDKNCKSNIGLKNEKTDQRSGRSFTIAERHKIIEEYLQTESTKQEVWEKYTGQKEEHGHLVVIQWSFIVILNSALLRFCCSSVLWFCCSAVLRFCCSVNCSL